MKKPSWNFFHTDHDIPQLPSASSLFEAEKAKKSEKAKAQAGEAAKKAVKATISKEKKPKEDPKAKAKGELMAFSRGFWTGGDRTKNPWFDQPDFDHSQMIHVETFFFGYWGVLP